MLLEKVSSKKRSNSLTWSEKGHLPHWNLSSIKLSPFDGGGTSGDWISLAGMVIVPDESNAVPLDLQNGWGHYGSQYGQATYAFSLQAV